MRRAYHSYYRVIMQFKFGYIRLESFLFTGGTEPGCLPGHNIRPEYDLFVILHNNPNIDRDIHIHGAIRIGSICIV